MIESSTAEVWRCTVCEWVWFKTSGKTPKRCPNPKCRKALKLTEWQMIVWVEARKRDLEHDPTTCRVYRCARCVAAGKKF